MNDRTIYAWKQPQEAVQDSISSSSERLSVVTEESIERLVRCFYVKVRGDAELGPVFEAAIAPDAWEAHLSAMRAFWSSLMLTSGRYKGNPLAVHKQVPDIQPEMFETWLRLFGETACELFADDVAGTFQAKAGRIAESFRFGLFYQPGTNDPASAR